MDSEEEDTITYVLEVKFNRTTKLPVFQRARLDGLRQDLPDGTPSEMAYDEQGRVIYLGRYDQDQPHAEGAPAIIHVNPDTGVHKSERFYLKGESYPQALGPRQITRDGQTGEVLGVHYDEVQQDGSAEPATAPTTVGLEPKM